MQEIFKDIPGYEGIYQVSNLGNVKSLSREICNHKGCYISNEKTLKKSVNSRGYYQISMLKESKRNVIKIHQLVAMAFLNHIPDGTTQKVVDHIDNNKINNNVLNLQIITQRENCSKDKKNKASKYTGVSWYSRLSNWRARIYINGKTISLGYFKTELEASIAYQNKLKEII